MSRFLQSHIKMVSLLLFLMVNTWNTCTFHELTYLVTQARDSQQSKLIQQRQDLFTGSTVLYMQ